MTTVVRTYQLTV